jgi:BASS family bile acid:Na+ symporter
MDLVLSISLVVFMAGSLFGLGLAVRIGDAAAGLRDARFLILAGLSAFVLGPVISWAITRALPLAEPYALGLLLLGLTPCAPFLPQMVERARGEAGYVPAMVILTAAGTVMLLPLALPVVAPGLSATAGEIARPLMLFVLIPLAAGMVLNGTRPDLAAAFRRPAGIATRIATAVMLLICAVKYGAGFVEAIGQLAIAAQVLFFAVVTAAAYMASAGIPPARRSVVALGVCTRNVGAAIAPLFSAAADERAVVMVVLAVPIQIVAAAVTARWFAAKAGPAASPGG